jgi:hypothetical protein
MFEKIVMVWFFPTCWILVKQRGITGGKEKVAPNIKN